MPESEQTEPAKPERDPRKKKPRGRAFTGADDPRRYVAGKAPSLPQDASGCDEATLLPDTPIQDLYEAIRRVGSGLKAVTPLEKLCWAGRRKNPERFLDRYYELERERRRVEVGREIAEEESIEDASSDRVEELIQRLLRGEGV